MVVTDMMMVVTDVAMVVTDVTLIVTDVTIDHRRHSYVIRDTCSALVTCHVHSLFLSRSL